MSQEKVFNHAPKIRDVEARNLALPQSEFITNLLVLIRFQFFQKKKFAGILSGLQLRNCQKFFVIIVFKSGLLLCWDQIQSATVFTVESKTLEAIFCISSLFYQMTKKNAINLLFFILMFIIFDQIFIIWLAEKSKILLKMGERMVRKRYINFQMAKQCFNGKK